MEAFEIFCGIAVVIFALYYFLTSTFDFWKSRGVPGPQPILGFGNFKKVILDKMPLSEFLLKLYNDYKNEPLIGLFLMRTPILFVKDPDLIKDILTKDFSVFADRGYTTHEKAEPLSQHLFYLESEKWRPLRAKLTFIFTSRKLKEMFSLMSECANHLIDYTEKLVSRNEPIECRELMAKYTTDVIGNCVFGIDMNALSNENSEFRRIGRNIFSPLWPDRIKARIKEFSPWLYDVLGYILPYTEITRFFLRLVVDTIDYREKNNIFRHDFIDLIREIKEQSDKMDDIDFTDSLMASLAFMFFAAGHETSSSMMTNTLYEMALNQKVQDRLREEIDQAYTKHGDNLTYENIKEMNYFDKVFKESLRKYPVGVFFVRKSASSYTFKGTNVNIPKGQRIWLSFHSLFRDPNIYPDPDVFDPERFNEEAVRNRHPMFFFPFGEGPRTCIGSRFAIYQTKLGLLKILRNYKIEPCKKTQIPYVFDESNFILAPKGGIYLKITKIHRD